VTYVNASFITARYSSALGEDDAFAFFLTADVARVTRACK
jgi:hypothetical protein